MLILLPLIALILLLVIFEHYYHCIRSSILASTIVLGIFITFTTELLSLLNSLSFVTVVIAWILLSIGLFFYFCYLINTKKYILKLHKTRNITRNITSSIDWVIVIFFLVLITVITAITAIISPPNNWDSMTYHMSRVVHWIQNQSVAHYPTYNLPQLFHPPFAEFVITHLQILSGDDRYANLVQWLCMVSSVIAVSLIAKELDANKRGQVFAAVFCATIPMGILQASSTQNDYAVAFWIVCLAYYVLLVVKDKNQPLDIVFLSASLGLAILTKSSGYIYAFPFMIWFSLVICLRWRWKVWQPLTVAIGTLIILNLGHYWRNYDLFGSIIPTPANFSGEYKIEVFSIPTLISNILKNMAFHVDIVRYFHLQNWITPTTGMVHKVLLIVHDWLGVDMFDPRTTEKSYSGLSGLSFDENTAVNPFHFFLTLLAIIGFFSFRKLRQNRLLFNYLFAVVGGFFLFCLLLKVQVYHPRHHVTVFVLFSAFVGVVFSKILNSRILMLIAVILLVSCTPWLFNNKFHPIATERNIFNMDRLEQYFIGRPNLEQPYVQAVNFILEQKCYDVGLSLGTGKTVGNQYWEYPLWIIFQQLSPSPIRLEHIDPENESNQKAQLENFQNFNPCAIFSVRTGDEPKISQFTTKSSTFQEQWSSKPVTVLMKQSVDP